MEERWDQFVRVLVVLTIEVKRRDAEVNRLGRSCVARVAARPTAKPGSRQRKAAVFAPIVVVEQRW